MRWNNQQDYGPWNAVADIAGAIMQRNQQRGQEKKDLQSTQSLFSLLQPSEVDTGTGMRSQVNFDPSLQSVKGAGPQKGLFDFAKIGQTPPIYNSPQEQQSIGLMQPQQITGQNALTMPQQPAPQIQAPTITQKERTIKNVEGDIRKNYATRMQEAIKSGNINPTMLRQYMPQIQQQMNSEIEQARGDYKKSQGDAALQDVLSANGSVAQKKAFIKYAQATGSMDPATLKGLLSSNTQKYDDGANIHFYRTDNFGNPIDTGENGSPQPYFSIPKQVSVETRASQDFQAVERQKDRDAAAANAAMRVSSGGGGGNGLSTANLFSLYKDATETVQEATGEFDSSGRPVMTRRIKNPELAQRLKPIIDSMLPGGGQSQDNYQPQPAQQDLSGKVSAARSKGISDSQIRSALLSDGLSQQEINALMGVQQQQRQQPELNPVGLDASMWY